MRLTVALPKGRLGKTSWDYLFDSIPYPFDDRKLTFENETYKILWVKPSDVLTYVEAGIADCGITGLDTLNELNPQVYRIKSLPYGICQLVVAGPKKVDEPAGATLKVATKYPNLARAYFKEKGQKIQCIPLQGSVELAPIVGLSDVIVDIVETGSTLKANDLEVKETIMHSHAMMVANPAKHRLKFNEIQTLLKKIRKEP